MVSGKYDFKKIEEKWSKRWSETGVYNIDVNDKKKPKFYNLAMFPYPSAASLHVGHAYTYSGVDVYGRFKRHLGYNVFQPMGFDAFGIHGENFAIKVNRHPADVLEENVVNYRRQMEKLGAMFDWSHSVNTTYPDYYKWTQWIFLQLYKHGLVERKSALVNWCPSCKTVLADEQVIQGKCERCSTVTEKKETLQWYFLITKYAQKLLDNHAKIDWAKKTIVLQRNWIGRSEGARISFDVEIRKGKLVQDSLAIFTTRPDTLMGMTFVLLSTKHPLIKKVPEEYYEKVEKFIKTAESMTAVENQKEKAGEFTGMYAINPIDSSKVPIYVANYVLSSYGTGALMGVPAHDERDFEFAKQYDLEIKKVVDTQDNQTLPYEGEGELIHSGKYNGLDTFKAREQIVSDLEKAHKGEFDVQYKLRDWLVSRQRYWGPPIPIIYCDKCGVVPVEDLPVFLPQIEDFIPKGDGKSPLARIESFVNTTCPTCGGKARRETDVLDNFVDSSWYFLRYPSVGHDGVPFDKDLTTKWLPVDMYIGGNEHAVLHLMYTRFIVMALHDMGYLDFDEPFNKFRVNGLIIKDGAKMSKSKGNVINPDDYMSKYGTDVLRIYLLFLGPFSVGGDFSDKNIVGVARFIEKVWGLEQMKPSGLKVIDDSVIQKLKNRITEEIDRQEYNKAIAGLMEYVNWLYKHIHAIHSKQYTQMKEDFVIMLSVFAPFISEELWELLGHTESIVNVEWPVIQTVQEAILSLPVQINGRMRGTIVVPHNALEKDAVESALKDKKLKKYLSGESYKRIVFVKNKILNIIY